MDGNGTQARIAGAFQRILRGKAYDSVTVREIAKEAGVTPRTFYSHFRSKGELLSFMLLSDLSGTDIPGHAAGWERIGLLLSPEAEGRTGTFNASCRVKPLSAKYTEHPMRQTLWDETEKIVKKYLS